MLNATQPRAGTNRVAMVPKRPSEAATGRLDSSQGQGSAQAHGACDATALALGGRTISSKLVHAGQLVVEGLQHVERNPAEGRHEEDGDGAETTVAGGDLSHLCGSLGIAGGQEGACSGRESQHLGHLWWQEGGFGKRKGSR